MMIDDSTSTSERTYLKPVSADGPLEVADDSFAPHLGLVHDHISGSFNEFGVGWEAVG
jgi:hypothetical protein